MKGEWEAHLRGEKGRGWGTAKHDNETHMDLKELESHPLGGGITLRRVMATGGVFTGTVSKRPWPSTFWLVTLVWEGRMRDLEGAWGSPVGSAMEEGGGLVEVRIWPPRPEDGPHGEGWLVTEWAGPAGTRGVYPSFEEARDAVVADLRQYDAARRLGRVEHPDEATG